MVCEGTSVPAGTMAVLRRGAPVKLTAQGASRVMIVGGARLEGSGKLKRLDFGAGQGDWKSTEWVADAVKVNFSLVLKAKT